ncbi:MAG TPA: EpsG family protein [Clostridiales bacterium]|nr:EpsG family protein [Clostridiales bacterium]
MNYYLLNIGFLLVSLMTYSITQNTRFNSLRIDRISSSILFLAFLFMIAFRPTAVADTIPYIKLFNSMDSYQFTLGLSRNISNVSRMEVGFINLCKFSSLISSSYRVFFFIVAFLSVGVGTVATILISKSWQDDSKAKYRILPALLLYISYYGFLDSGIALRAGLAISFCLLSYAMLVRNRYLLSSITYLLAFSFHNSILVFLIVIAIYLIIPAMSINTYRILALAILGLYFFRFFDLFQVFIIQIARFLANHISVLSFFNSYLNGEFLDSGFLKTILFFMLEFVYLTFCFTDDISNKQKKTLNVIMLVSIIAALVGSFPVIVRILDILFVVMLPALYFTLMGISKDERFTLGNIVSVRKYPICALGFGVIVVANFLLYSRLAGYLEIFGLR